MATMLAETADALEPEVRQALRDLILVLADSKRLLGFRYGSWILGAPELETGIACAAMAQDEWGHARLLYALLKDFGDDVEHLEHGREPHEYFSMQVLDREPEDWAAVVALNVLADGALSLQLHALRDCCYLPLRQRTEKLLAEERYHRAHGNAWARRYVDGSTEAAGTFERAVRAALPPIVFWFGLEGGRGTLLARAGGCAGGPDDLRGAFLARNAPLLNALRAHGPEAWSIGMDDFDDVRRRGPGGPDADTIARVRGDRNRDFLVEQMAKLSATELGLPERVPCPFCDGLDTELHSAFGSQLSVATYWCRRCATAFESFRVDDAAVGSPADSPKTGNGED